MSLTVSGAGIRSRTEGILVDITEAWEGFLAQATTVTVAAEARGAVATPNAAAFGASVLFPTNFGGAVALAYDAAIGRSVINTVSLAGTQHGRAPTSASAQGVKIPLGQRFSVANALPVAFFRPLRSYTLRVPVRLPAIAGGAAFVGCSDGAAGELAGLPFSCSYGWVADPTINAGRYTARYRQTAGGAIVTVGDSGILGNATTWHELGIRYTEGPTPKFEWLMDNVPVFIVSGDAFMGVVTGPTVGPFPCISTLLGAGTTLQNAAARYIVEEVS